MPVTTKSGMKMLLPPTDPDLLAAVGLVVLRQGHLDYVVRLLVKPLEGLGHRQALDATARNGPAKLQKRIMGRARSAISDPATFARFEDLVARYKALADERNAIVHGVWARELDGECGMLDEHHHWRPLPRPEALAELAERMRVLMVEINAARLEGFIREALGTAGAAPEAP